MYEPYVKISERMGEPDGRYRGDNLAMDRDMVLRIRHFFVLARKHSVTLYKDVGLTYVKESPDNCQESEGLQDINEWNTV